MQSRVDVSDENVVISSETLSELSTLPKLYNTKLEPSIFEDHHTLDYEIFDHTGRDDLDIVYLGVEVNVPLFEILLLAPPPIREMKGLVQSDATSDSMQLSADYGMVLKVGGHAYEEVKDADNKRAPCPYKPGDWVSFEEFHPQGRKYNGVLTYCIADSRILNSVPDLEHWDVYLLFENNLKKIRERAVNWRNMSRKERFLAAGSVIEYD